MADGDFNDKTTSFVIWLQRSGTSVSEKITIADLRQHTAGRGVVAVDNIDEDEELFSIPRSAILTAENSSLDVEVTKQVEDPWLSLILAMICEYQLGQASKWHQYLDILPHEFDTLMYWSEHELKFLNGSAVVNKIGKETANTTFTDTLIPIVRQHAATFKADDLSDVELLSVFHRMGSIIMAYAFDLESTTQPPQGEDDGWEEDSDAGSVLPKGMVPLADMLNADADRNNAKLFYEDDKVVMKTIKTVKKGEELFNDYGPLPRADVLRRYGYVTENYAKYDVVEIPLELVKEVVVEQSVLSKPELESRLEYLEEQGVADDGYDVAREANEDGQIPEELIVLVETLTLPQDGFAKLKKKEKLPEPELSKNSAQLLEQVLMKRQRQYNPPSKQVGSLSITEFDMGGADEDPVGVARARRRHEMASQVIMGEIGVLGEAVASMRKLLEGHDTKRKAENGETSSAQGGKRQRTK
ncbi:Ribosomal lysine N-methyltransferase 4 [Saxophila tyrrhenica]|uniref:Ribosomal lysine N-methyltransferase 4 n=1 Tax=Saxophila tyrrhenica TaxID=1690608 RepID=A0AAV9P882_9PEZI|nr:Ribosomal lysine N-methyltransferase 4 [Saxophila tyrrhenica]